MSIIDPALVAALHVRRQNRAAFDEPGGDADAGAGAHIVWQTSSIDALLDGAYEGDLTLGELCAHGDLGIGTVQQLDGELVIVDGVCFAIRADGRVEELPAETRTPFAVVCRFTPGPARELSGPLRLSSLTERVDAVAPTVEPVVAVRVDGVFCDLRLRSVPRQHPPYPSLAEVVTHQTEWTVARATGSIVGFRFPDEAQGIDVAGYHLHFLADDRRRGGHVIDLTLLEGTLRVDGAHELHLEVPAGVRVALADASAAKQAAIRAVEHGAGDGPA